MKLLIIDLFSFIYQTPNQFKKFSNTNGYPTGHIYSFLQKLISCSTFNFDYILFVKDSGRSGRDIFNSEYKANREKFSTPFIAEDILEIIKLLPVGLCYCDDYEADDVIYTIIKKISKINKYEVSLLSKDYDQAYNLMYYPQVRHFLSLNQEVTPYNLYIGLGCYPNKLILYKSIFGDSSDNIRPLKMDKKIKDKIKVSFIKDRSFRDILSSIPEANIKKLKENVKTILPKKVPKLKMDYYSYNKEILNQLLQKYEIKAITTVKLEKLFNKDIA